MAASSPSPSSGRLGSGSNGPSKKMIVVPLDTSDTINLNHLDVLPMQLVGCLDRNSIQNVNVEIKAKTPATSVLATNHVPYPNMDKDKDKAVKINLNSESQNMTTQLQLLTPNYNLNRKHYSDHTKNDLRAKKMNRKSTNSIDSETAECFKQVRLNNKLMHLRNRKTLTLEDILPEDDNDSKSNLDGNQNYVLSSNTPPSAQLSSAEGSWAGIPEAIQKNIVNKILKLGFTCQGRPDSRPHSGAGTGTKASDALRKLQEALKDIQNDWQSDFTTTSSSQTQNEYQEGQEGSEIESVSEISKSAITSSECLSSSFTNIPTIKSEQQKRDQLSPFKYKPPEGMSILKSQQVLTLCQNRNDIFTCQSSDCSIIPQGKQTNILVTVTASKASPPSIKGAFELNSEQTEQDSNKPAEISLEADPSSSMLTQQLQEIMEPKLSPEKVAAIWNWVSPKYDQISLNQFLDSKTGVHPVQSKPKAEEKQKNIKNSRTKGVQRKNSKGQGQVKLVKRQKPNNAKCSKKKTVKVTKSKTIKLEKSNDVLNSDTIISKPNPNHNDPHLQPSQSRSRSKHVLASCRPSTPSLSLEHRNFNDGTHNATINRNRNDPCDCQLFLSDPITENAFTCISFKDGSFSDVNDVLPSRPFRGGPSHLSTGHLDTYVGQVLSSNRFSKDECNVCRCSISGEHLDEDQETDINKGEDEEKDHECDSDLDLERLTPPSTSTWNLSPLYETEASAGNNKKSSPTCTSHNGKGFTGKYSAGANKNEYGEGTEEGKGMEFNTECHSFPSDDLFVASMADVHSGDEVVTRCSTTSSITEFEHNGVQCVSNSNIKVRINKLSSIRNKLRLFDLLNGQCKVETDEENLDEFPNSNQPAKSLPRSGLESTATADAPGSDVSNKNEHILEENTENNKNHSSLNSPNHFQNPEGIQKEKLKVIFENPECPHHTAIAGKASGSQASMKKQYFLPLPPTDALNLELTIRKSYDSMKAQPPSRKSPQHTAIAGPDTTAKVTTTTERQSNGKYHITLQQSSSTSECILQAPVVSLSAEQEPKLSKLSNESIVKKLKKNKRRRKRDEEEIGNCTIEGPGITTAGTVTVETEETKVKEKKHRRHRRHEQPRDDSNNYDDHEHQNNNDTDYTKKRTKSKREKNKAPLEKLKNNLPRTPSGHYALQTKEAEDAIAEYVKSELAACLGIGIDPDNLDTTDAAPAGSSQCKLNPDCFRHLVRTVTSTLIGANTDNIIDTNNNNKKETSGNVSNTLSVVADQLQVKEHSKKFSGIAGNLINPGTRTPTKMKLLSQSKSLKLLNKKSNNSNPFQRIKTKSQVMDLAATKKRMSIGVIPKESTRANFLQYQENSIVAMLNITKARKNQYPNQNQSHRHHVSVRGSKFSGFSPGGIRRSGSRYKSLGTGSGSGIVLGNHSGSTNHNLTENCSPTRPSNSNLQHKKSFLDNNGSFNSSTISTVRLNNNNLLNHNRPKTNRNAVTVVFDSSGNTAIGK